MSDSKKLKYLAGFEPIPLIPVMADYLLCYSMIKQINLNHGPLIPEQLFNQLSHHHFDKLIRGPVVSVSLEQQPYQLNYNYPGNNYH